MFVTYADEHLFHAMVYYIHVPLIILLYYVGTGPLHDKSDLRRASRLGSTFFSFQMYDWVISIGAWAILNCEISMGHIVSCTIY
jgi:hypothetical protein